MVKKISLSNVHETSKLFLLAIVGGGLFWLLLSYMGYVDMSIEGHEIALWLALGGFLLSEIVLENGKALKQMDPIVVLELGVAVVVLGYGIALLGGSTDWLAYLSPYKVYILGLGLIFGFLEVRTKI